MREFLYSSGSNDYNYIDCMSPSLPPPNTHNLVCSARLEMGPDTRRRDSLIGCVIYPLPLAGHTTIKIYHILILEQNQLFSSLVSTCGTISNWNKIFAFESDQNTPQCESELGSAINRKICSYENIWWCWVVAHRSPKRLLIQSSFYFWKLFGPFE